jgi:hypothetical protein
VNGVTRPSQKQRERFFTEQAIRSLGYGWTIREECEPPDFIITEGDHHFGLDVAEIFMGQQSGRGSTMKRDESEIHNALNALRLRYETETGINLNVKFLGRIGPDTLADVVSDLVALDLASKPLAYQTVIEKRPGLEAGLKLFVTKSLRPEWYSANDRVGWVTRNPQNIIAAEIKKKSKKLPQYKAAAGDDIRLLLVADRVQNSGKIDNQVEDAFDFHGFKAVYLYPHPEDAIALREASRWRDL